MRRHRYGQRRNGGSGSLLLIGILILAVAAGYAGTKYVIAPYILEGRLWTAAGDPAGDVPENGSATAGSGVVSGQQDIKDAKEMTTDAAVAPGGVTGGAAQPPAAAPQAAQPPAAAPQATSGGAAQTQSGAQTAVASSAAPAGSGGYAVQFGSFSAKESAQQAVSELAAKSITASVVERNGAFKVVGTVFDTKEKAKAEAERLKAIAEDAFVTAL
ncbi:SPOR domain-containing protein [Bacilliculturomica massiliensis]|uniref:SPOR domain-containing protein n=1 Tax=Bacilliculturomica massiliensis TaxID=1917867 RepID=UPI001031C769|nr:SPOR domain-containing protein [Bacilliculturomica massiliensis]